MIKVLIVDDEPKLREGLRTFIDWEAHGFTVVDTAASGNEALSKYQRHLPGLIIADIRMPGMDGLQLIEALRESDSKLHILILSGYADFDYAKKAITHKADGYLLKPVDEDELISCLERIRALWLKEREAERWRHLTDDVSREALIQSLLANPGEEHIDALRSKAGALGMLWKTYQVFLISLRAPEDSDAECASVLKRHLTERFEHRGRGTVFLLHAHIGVLLKEPLLAVEAGEIYREIGETLAGTGAEFVAAVGTRVGSLQEVEASYLAARELIRRHFFLEDGKVLDTESAAAECGPEEGDGEPLDDLGDRMYYAVDIGNWEAARALVRRAGQSFVSAGCTEAEIKRRFADLLTYVLGKGLKRHSELQGRGEEYSDHVAGIYRVRSLRALYEHADVFLKRIAGDLGGDGKAREVKALLDLIERNFGDNLKLEKLSGIFHYNSAYLGKLFKNATGEYFNTYLDKVRIEKAKLYLQKGWKVYQVAEKVGYTNVDYFHSKFRKYVGISPSAYRKKAGSI